MDVSIFYIAQIIIIILFSMVLHEVMHGLVALWLGDDTAKMQGRLTLNPVKHIDPFMTILLPVVLAIIGGPIFGGAKPVMINTSRLKYDEWGWALVSVMGPITNLFIAFIAYGLANILGSGAVAEFLVLTCIVNVGFFVFNMLPLPPLDGSRLLYAIAPDFLRDILSALEKYALFLIFFLVMFSNGLVGQVISGGIRFILEIFSRIFV